MRIPHVLSLKRFVAGSSALLLVGLLVFAGCGGTGATPGSTPTTGAPTPAVSDPAYWGPIVGLHAGDTIQSVSLGHLLGDTTQQALVTVRVAGAGGYLNVCVYDQISSAHPQALFTLQGLLLGDARISQANTLLTAQSDGSAATSGGLVQDLFREFQWSASAKAFVQIAFPGIYPDLTRWQAEGDQAKVNAGQDSWKLDATKTAQHLANALLKWPLDASASLVSGGGAQDSQAVVRVTSPNPLKPIITVTLKRFDEVTTNGIWEVTEVQGETGLTLTSPQSGATLTSPITVKGTGNAFEGDAGALYVYNRLYTTVGQAKAVGDIGMGQTPFTTTVTYTSSFQGGAQEGILALYDTAPGIGGPIASAVMVKVLLSA